MAMAQGAATPQWTSRFAFLMAAIGSAVGLGNLWRFPFLTGQYGGSAFVLVYLVCVALVAYPILMSELMVGRHKGLSAIMSAAHLAQDAGKSPNWGIVGVVGVVGAVLLLTTYSVIAGQVTAYSIMSFLGEFKGDAASSSLPLYSGQGAALLWHTLFMIATIAVVGMGLNNGIEKLVTILMPAFFVLLVILCIYALTTGAGAKAVSFLFTPRFNELTAETVLAALGQAFFSLSLGCGTMLTYGSFLSREENIASNAGVIAASDTLVAVVSGLMIFPIVIAFNLDPAQGMGLIFNAMPNVFAGMPFGSLVGGVFFLLAFVAALTSAISLLIVAAVVGEDFLGLNKWMSSAVFGGGIWAIGAATIFNVDLGPWLDFVSGSIALPVGGLLIAILVGWVAPKAAMRSELPHASDGMFAAWHFVIRYIAPTAVIIILILGLDAKFGWGINALISGK